MCSYTTYDITNAENIFRNDRITFNYMYLEIALSMIFPHETNLNIFEEKPSQQIYTKGIKILSF